MTTEAPRPAAARRRVRCGPALVVAAVAVSCVAGCDGRNRSFFAAYGKPTAEQLELNVDACNEELSVEVEESAAEVRVRVTSDRALGRSGGDCADSVTVRLSKPLGDRRVVDVSSGAIVDVEPPN